MSAMCCLQIIPLLLTRRCKFMLGKQFQFVMKCLSGLCHIFFFGEGGSAVTGDLGLVNCSQCFVASWVRQTATTIR